MEKSVNFKFEKAVRFLTKYMQPSKHDSRKPILFHDIRVGMYLYDRGYPEDVVLAGVLHDALEWSTATEQILKDEFGENVTRLVMANTKNDLLLDKTEKTNELIRRCAQNGQEALIVKTADIIDSFGWYSSQNNLSEIEYCMRNADAIFKFKPENFEDKIFQELKTWQEKFKMDLKNNGTEPQPFQTLTMQ